MCVYVFLRYTGTDTYIDMDVDTDIDADPEGKNAAKDKAYKQGLGMALETRRLDKASS